MNEKEPFIIEDLDEYHLIIKADEEYKIRKDLEAEVRTPPSSKRYPFSGLFISSSWKRIRTAWRPVNDHLYRPGEQVYQSCKDAN